MKAGACEKGRVERESGVCVGEVRADWGGGGGGEILLKTCVKVFLIFFYFWLCSGNFVLD